ncbi:Gar1/Naf1 RNA binding region [Candidatus Methanoperedenaceae archaeon GB50]|nr:MAG: Gar1/Naf1 RNA binding region [Candidatus Methanoperedenaceae archaeon GB50]CAD7772418.1 Gar1/Naf1 RNA binding region [Candidatus Methanoperedenaceae archaeon GB50]
MKRLGTVLHVIHNGELIVQCNGMMKGSWLNAVVLSEDLKRLGKVVDIFGPVSRPYCSIKPFKGSKPRMHELKERMIYIK